jgi:hypothetical protein
VLTLNTKNNMNFALFYQKYFNFVITHPAQKEGTTP